MVGAKKATRDVVQHEAAHGVAGAIAVVHLGCGSDYYAASSLRFKIKRMSGWVWFEPPRFDHPTKKQYRQCEQVLALGALGPVSAMPLDRIFAHYRKGEDYRLFHKAGLSDSDIDTYDGWRGTRLKPLRTIVSTKLLFENLGPDGTHHLFRQVRRLSADRQSVKLGDFVPYERARKASKRAAKLVAKNMADVPMKEPWHER